MKHINSSLSLLVWLNESVIQHGVVILFVCCTVCYRLLSVCACLSVGCVVVFCAFFFVLSFPIRLIRFIHSIRWIHSFLLHSFSLLPVFRHFSLVVMDWLVGGWRGVVAQNGSINRKNPGCSADQSEMFLKRLGFLDTILFQNFLTDVSCCSKEKLPWPESAPHPQYAHL